MIEHLYNITHQIREIIAIAEEDGLTEELVSKLDSLQLSRDEKIDAYCAIIAEQQGLGETAKHEATRLLKRANIRFNTADRLKKCLVEDLKALDLKRHETTLNKIWRQRNGQPTTACLIPVEKLDPTFVKQLPVPDTEAARQYWKETGKAPEGFQIEVGEHLRIA